jgi:hypothetical protein
LQVGDEKWLGRRLDFWDDTAAVFEPAKVVRLLRRTFPDAEVDPTDHQQLRLERELGFWSRDGVAPELRATLVRQSWGLYKTNGPTYRFVVPFPPGHRVRGQARRLSAGFWLPPGLPPEHQEQLRAFLASLRMGVTELDDCDEAEPGAAPDPARIIVSGDS